jgi:MYXO-CTERM domain-containing protein
MVQYAIKQTNAAPTKVFAAGASSGACMTQTLLASYPEVFAAGSSLAGVPVGAWPPGTSCTGVCSTPAPSKTAQQWGDLARGADPGFAGSRPRVQLWHGTNDTTLVYPSMSDAEDAQWTNVFAVTNADATKTSGDPSSVWSRTSYMDSSGTVVLEVDIGQGEPHDLTSISPSLFPDVIHFFGLDHASTPGMGGSGGGGSGAADAGGAGGVGGARDAAVDASGSSAAGGVGGADSGGSGGSGGAPGSGGSASGNTGGSGGSSVQGGGGGSGGAASSTGGGKTSGCSCTAGGSPAPGSGALLLFTAIGLVRRRRAMRRRSSPQGGAA